MLGGRLGSAALANVGKERRARQHQSERETAHRASARERGNSVGFMVAPPPHLTGWALRPEARGTGRLPECLGEKVSGGAVYQGPCVGPCWLGALLSYVAGVTGQGEGDTAVEGLTGGRGQQISAGLSGKRGPPGPAGRSVRRAAHGWRPFGTAAQRAGVYGTASNPFCAPSGL